MNPIERKLLWQSALIGTALTLVVVAADRWGLLDPLERSLYDRRARDCQFFTPPPTDKLVHLDIDDAALDAMGHWPWPRSRLGEILDELNLAGAKAVALDVIFPEPQQVDYRPESGEVSFDPKAAEASGKFEIVRDDDVFAESIRRGGRTLVPFSIDPEPRRTPRGEALVDALTKDLELDQKEAEQQLTSRGLGIAPGKNVKEHDRFLEARRVAMFNRVIVELQRKDQTVGELRARLLPRTETAGTHSPLTRLLKDEYDRAEAILSLRRFSRPKPDGLPLIMPSELSLVPTPVIARAAGGSGYVFYLPDEDGVVRSIPLWAEHRGHLFPQFALSLACTMLDVKPADIRLEPDRMILPRPGGRDIVIPVRMQRVNDVNADAGFFFDIPWFGTSDWKVMYDPRHETTAGHSSILRVWDIHELLDRIVTNNRSADKTIRYVIDKLAPERRKEFDAQRIPLEDSTARIEWIDWSYNQFKENGWFDIYKNDTEQGLYEKLVAAQKKMSEARAAAAQAPKDQALAAKAAELSGDVDKAHDDEELFSTIEAMRQLPDQTRKLKGDLDHMRDSLRVDVTGNAVIIGWTATAAAADFVPTSLHGKCPGAVVHGVIFNAIMTGQFWWRAPPWVSILITLLIGLLTTAIVASLPPLRGAICAALVGVGYLAVNGIVLFDYGNMIVGAAGPLTSMAAVWSGTTIWKFIAEIAERRRITRRFSSYADPRLVNYVLEHPDEVKFDGQVREMSVVFTDLAGFTTLSERLKEKTVGILNEYLALMVPVINNNHGLVNKFLGDGIMFFYGAPENTPDHALQAVRTVLKMQAAMVGFNRGLEERGLPTLHMRAGVSTGSMIVGDAGSDERSDYTVLGDNVNLASRLESANKYTGTRILINDRAAALVGEMFLLRPIGKLRVVGKTEGVMTYEPLCAMEEATPEQKQIVEVSHAAVEAFQKARFYECLRTITSLDDTHGPSGLTHLYAELCRQYVAHAPGDDFQGLIILTEK